MFLGEEEARKENSVETKNGDQLLLQLHEQYAINNNANWGHTITLIVALIVVFGFWGNIFLKSTSEFSNSVTYAFYNSCKDTYTLDALFFATIAVNVVLTIIVRICLSQGFAQRYEQFITHAIRYKYLFKTNLVVDPCRASLRSHGDFIFPQGGIFEKDISNGYHPFFKRGISIVQGLYGDFIYIAIVLSVAMLIFLIYKTPASCVCDFFKCFCKSSGGCFWILTYFISTIAGVIWCFCSFNKKSRKYHRLEMEYSNVR